MYPPEEMIGTPESLDATRLSESDFDELIAEYDRAHECIWKGHWREVGCNASKCPVHGKAQR